jgi:hypothetical protein
MISRILIAFAESGASASELSNLLRTWEKEKTLRGARAA